MNKYFTRFFLLLVTAGALGSCRESSKIPAPAIESIPLVIPEINPQKSYFDYATSRPSNNTIKANNLTRPVFEFVVNPSQGYGEIQTVEVYKSISRNDILGPRVKQMDLNSFPATVSLTSQEAIQDLYYSTPKTTTTQVAGPTDALQNRMFSGEAVVFTFEYIMKDGRRITLTPLSVSPSSLGAPTGTFVNKPYAAIAVFTTK